MKVAKSFFEIDLSLYSDALNLCIHDDDWLKEAFLCKENIYEYTKNISEKNPHRVISEYIYMGDVSAILKYKNKRQLNENEIAFWFDQESELAKLNLIRSIYEKTNYHAKSIKHLLEDYCDQSRDNFDAKIVPCPVDIKETIKPVKNFKIHLNESKEFHVELCERTVKIHSSDPAFKNIKNYFTERLQSKKIDRAYISSDILSENKFEKITNDLLYLKEVEIPTSQLTQNLSDYKVIYRSNQAYNVDNQSYTLTGKNFKVLHIERCS